MDKDKKIEEILQEIRDHLRKVSELTGEIDRKLLGMKKNRENVEKKQFVKLDILKESQLGKKVQTNMENIKEMLNSLAILDYIKSLD